MFPSSKPFLLLQDISKKRELPYPFNVQSKMRSVNRYSDHGFFYTTHKSIKQANTDDCTDLICPGVNKFVAALEVQQACNPLTYNQILQSIAIHIPKVVTFNSTRRNVSELETRCTRDGSW